MISCYTTVGDMMYKDIKLKSLDEPKSIFIKQMFTILLIFSLLVTFTLALFNCFKFSSDSFLGSLIINTVITFLISPLVLNHMFTYLNNSFDKIISYKDLFLKPNFKFALYNTSLNIIYFIISYIFSLIPIIGFLLNLILLIFFIPIIFFFPFIFIENEGNFIDLIKLTFKLINDNLKQFYGLLFSFGIWIIAGLFTLGILYFWLIPYMFITFTYQYNYFKDDIVLDKDYKKSIGAVVLVIFLVLILTFIKVPYSFPNFINTIFNYNIIKTKGDYSLEYGSVRIASYNVPKGYVLSHKTGSVATYTNKKSIVQYAVYLSDINTQIKADKKEHFNSKISDLKVKGSTLKMLSYKEDGENSITVYYPKKSFVITISIYSENKIKNIKEFIKIY